MHGTETGGYFRCNRWQEDGGSDHEFYDTPPNPEEVVVPTNEDLSDPSRMRVIYGTAMHESMIARKKARDAGRFIHHFHRWSSHSSSRKLESNMAGNICNKMGPAVQAARDFLGDPDFNFGGKGLSFLHAAFTELDECRSVLLHSYPFSYYRYASVDQRTLQGRQYRRFSKEKKQYEKLQSALETVTEHLSDIVARNRIRANESQIQYLSVTSAEKRRDFTNFIINVQSEERKRSRRDANLGQTDVVTRIAGVAGESVDNPTEPLAEDALQTMVEEFQLRSESHELSDVDSEGFAEEETGNKMPTWSCSDCTFINSGRRTSCEMCGRRASEGDSSEDFAWNSDD